LPTRVAAHHVRIAEKSRSGVSVRCFHKMCIGIGVVARRPELLFAKVATAARECERNHYAVSALQIRYLASNLFHQTHKLVAEDISSLHGRNEAVI